MSATSEHRSATSNPAPLGLIAGQGALPLLVARGMKHAGRSVCCVGLRHQFDDELHALCDTLKPAGIAQPGKWIRLFRKWNVREAVMVGRVAKQKVHDPWRLLRELPDWRAVNIWYRRLRHDRRNAAVLAAVADELQRSGITLIDSTKYIPDHLADAGALTPNDPTEMQQQDIAFGWPLLEQIAAMDIGQSIVVRERDVIAVEAVEGTAELIKRAGALCRSPGWTLLKTSKPDHDMRADVPTIGVETIEQVKSAGGGCIALGAGRVILIDKPQVVEAARKAGVVLVGR